MILLWDVEEYIIWLKLFLIKLTSWAVSDYTVYVNIKLDSKLGCDSFFQIVSLIDDHFPTFFFTF